MLPPPDLELSAVLENASTAIVSSAMAAATSLVAIGVDNGTATSPPKESGECSLLGPFAILVQSSLGILALLSLVYKRWRERPQRPMKIWSFDVSKQVVGSVLVHIANLLMSMLSSGQFSVTVDPGVVAQRNLGGEGIGMLAAGLVRRVITSGVDEMGNYRPNPCSFYLLNLAIDTTVGIPILILLVRVLTGLFTMTPFGNPPESLQSGNYGSPPKAFWWFKQSIIYFMGLMGMKICVLVIFLAAPWISRVGDWALKWTEGDEVLQVIFVMFVFPVIMNATQYYIIDSFIKNQKPEGGHERIPDHDQENEDHTAPYEDPRSGSSEDIHSEDGDDAEVAAKVQAGKNSPKESVSTKERDYSSSSGSSRSKAGRLQMGSRDYDPLLDGESSPPVVGSGSGSERGRLQAESEQNMNNDSLGE